MLFTLIKSQWPGLIVFHNIASFGFYCNIHFVRLLNSWKNWLDRQLDTRLIMWHSVIIRMLSESLIVLNHLPSKRPLLSTSYKTYSLSIILRKVKFPCFPLGFCIKATIRRYMCSTPCETFSLPTVLFWGRKDLLSFPSAAFRIDVLLSCTDKALFFNWTSKKKIVFRQQMTFEMNG